MSYQINFTDSVNKGFLEVDVNSVNTETSLSLPGRTKSDYGVLILENLLHLLENFANNNPPNSPVEGQLWYDTTVGVDQLKVYDGAQWVSASSIKKSNSRPEAVESNVGDLWVDTTNQQLFLYNGNSWTLIGPEFSLGANTGSKFEEILDITNAPHSVIINYVDNVPVAIIANEEFKPKSTIAGFSTIRPGINLSSSTKYYGITEVAESLLVPGDGTVISSNFARRDRENTFFREQRIQNNSGMRIGETPTLQFLIQGSDSIVRNLASGGDIRFNLTQGVGSGSVLTIKSDRKIGINKTNPSTELDVVGSIDATENLNVSGNTQLSGTLSVGNNLTVSGSSSLNNINVSDIMPNNSTRSIGSSTNRFNNIFVQTINSNNFVGGTFSGTLNGDVNGPATRLSANTNFVLGGDVSSNTIVFGGTNNVGGTKTFNTVLSPTVITNKPEASSISSLDEILIVRENDGSIAKVKQEVLVSNVPFIPIGMITPYGGSTPPPGWLLCDGSAVSQSVYSRLWEVIGDKFDPSFTNNSQFFRLPDLRGRFPLGYAGMQNVNNLGDPLDPNHPIVDTDAINEPSSNELGARDGSNSKSIEIENLPDHSHRLRGDEGTDFYAISNIDNALDSEVDGNAPDVAGELPSSSVRETGGVIGASGTPLSVVNPYQTVNYIIFAGVGN